MLPTIPPLHNLLLTTCLLISSLPQVRHELEEVPQSAQNVIITVYCSAYPLGSVLGLLLSGEMISVVRNLSASLSHT